jgi:hypothetical protein
MPVLRFTITEELIHEIGLRVQSGAYPHVAAEDVGIPAEMFQVWMERGTRPDARDPYRALAERVRQARAHARVQAEVEMRRTDPKAWLLNGPGKGTPDEPGWSAPVKAQVTREGRTVNVLLDPQMQSLYAAILQVLTPFPEARAAIAAVLEEKTPPSD